MRDGNAERTSPPTVSASTTSAMNESVRQPRATVGGGIIAALP